MKYMSPVMFQSISYLNYVVIKFAGLPLLVLVCAVVGDTKERQAHRRDGFEKLIYMLSYTADPSFRFFYILLIRHFR